MKKKIVLSVICFLVLVACVVIILIKTGAKDSGEVTIVIGDNLVNEKIKYKENDTLSDILIEKYNAKIDNGMLKSISSLSHNDEKHEYIAFYINDEYSSVGVNEAELIDGNIYKFIIETW